MRDYGIVSPKFWTGDTGKQLRADPQCQVLALYLMTSPHATMIGVYYCPIMYMAHETGLGMEGATKALARLIEMGFCAFHEASETVFVTNMAAYQIAEQLKPDDKRVMGVRREVEKMPAGEIKTAFLATYSVAFHLVQEAPKTPSAQAPSKPLPSQKQEQDQEQEQDQKKPTATSPAKLPTCPSSDLIALYHEVLPELPAVRLMNDQRKRALAKVWGWVLTSSTPEGTRRATTPAEALEWFRRYFERARDNDFLMGRTARNGEHAGWRCDLDFLLTDKGMKQVIEKTSEAA